MPTSICRIVVLNLQRACQLAIDMALRIGPTRRLALPADTAEMFRILAQAGLITRDLGESLKRMVGFRNVAVHGYQELDLAKVRAIIETPASSTSPPSPKLCSRPIPPAESGPKLVFPGALC